VPLLSAGNPYSDGAVSGIAHVLPAHCPDRDREAVERAIRAWAASGFELLLAARSHGQPVRLLLEELGIDRADVRQRRWLDDALTARRKTATRNIIWLTHDYRSAQLRDHAVRAAARADRRSRDGP
jgi:hypothetical protein